MAAQPSDWAAVGAAKVDSNQARTGALNGASGSVTAGRLGGATTGPRSIGLRSSFDHMFGSFMMCHPADTGHDRPMTSHPDRRRRLGSGLDDPSQVTEMIASAAVTGDHPAVPNASAGIGGTRMNAHLHELAHIRQAEMLADAERARLARRSRQAHRPAARETRIRPVVEVIAAATSAAPLLPATGALP